MDRERAMKPRVLVVEDDPVSRAFFEAVLSGLPLEVEAVGRCDAALGRAAATRHALWLVDATLPDGTALTLLPGLRAHAPEAVAVAHTASRDPGLHAALRSAGYVEVLEKPVPAGRLHAVLGRWLRLPVREEHPAFAAGPRPARAAVTPTTAHWDDAGALRALGGDPARVAALRGLFLAELPGAVRGIEAAAAAGDDAAVRASLHRLVAACALAGATPLGDAVRRLHAAPRDADALDGFARAARALAAL